MKPPRRSRTRPSRPASGDPARLEDARSRLTDGDADGAARVLDALLARHPRQADALNLRGVAALRTGDAAQGAAFLARAVVAAPGESAYRENLAEALLRAGRTDEAARHAERVRAAMPGRARPHALLGRAALALGDATGAAGHLRTALAMGEGGPEVLLALAVALMRTGHADDALRACDAVLAARPGDPSAWLDRGMALKSLGRLDEAAAAFARAGDSPAARYDRGLIALAQGRLAEGFEGLEARHEIGGPLARPDRPHWRGDARPGDTLMVLAEQGLGDTLLASRCFRAVRARFARVVVVVPEPLVRLFRTCVDDVEFAESASGVSADVVVGALSLPHRLGVRTMADAPPAPWLRVQAPPRTRERLRVGLNWAGNPRYAWDAIRSTPLETFAPLLSLGDIEWVSLHRGVREHEASEYGLHEPLAAARDFLETAEVLATLDLVISTETAIPNLAGAMGIPTAVLTTPDVDWRWRGWYPSVVACPQDRPGEWPGALARALEVLAGVASARAA